LGGTDNNIPSNEFIFSGFIVYDVARNNKMKTGTRLHANSNTVTLVSLNQQLQEFLTVQPKSSNSCKVTTEINPNKQPEAQLPLDLVVRNQDNNSRGTTWNSSLE
jgi:hypothetical protein